MMDKEFEMQSEKPDPIIVQRPNIPNDYGPQRLSDLLDGDDLSSALEWYSLALANFTTTPAQAFVRSIRSMYYEKDVARIMEGEPKPRTFTAGELQAAIQFFTEKQIQIEHINKWGKGIDPYLNDLEND